MDVNFNKPDFYHQSLNSSTRTTLVRIGSGVIFGLETDELEVLENNTKEIILVKDSKSGFADAFTPPSSRPSPSNSGQFGRKTATGSGGSNSGSSGDAICPTSSNLRVASKVINRDDSFVKKPKKKKNSPHPHDVKIESEGVIITDKQAQKKLQSHGEDFGLKVESGDKYPKLNRENINIFKENMKQHIKNPETKRIKGTYRKKVEAIQFVNDKE
jgi:hypothetical protein